MDIQGDMPITLVIKAPNQRMEDQTVDCMLGWTIRKLKHHLERVYPSKPKHNEQRLIYSGKLLQDHLTLKEILKQYDTETSSSTHTVHLVCSNPSPKTPATSSTSQGATDKSPQPVVSSPGSQNMPQPEVTQPLPPTDSTSPQNDGLRYRGPPQPQQVPFSTAFQHFPGQPSPMASPMANSFMPPAGYPYTPEQYAWMVQQQQQAYTQYMMQYMQYYQQNMYNAGGQPFMAGGMIPPINPLNMPNVPNPSPVPQPQQQQQPDQPVQEQNQPAAGNANNGQRGNNVRMNAQGGVEEDDEEERDPRDWLHHIYLIVRYFTFISIIVFYSSFSRFLMVTAGFLVIYFFQKMRVAREQNARRQQQEQLQREEVQRQQEQQQQQEQEQQQQEQQVENHAAEQQPQEPQVRNNVEENGSTSEETPSDANQGQSEEEVIEQDGSKIKRLLFFVMKTVESFFLSLIPAPPELEAN